MSTAVFPTLPGIAWSVKKTPQWATQIQTATSKRELRAQLSAYPVWKIALTYNVLRAAAAYQELQSLVGFFNMRGGSFDTFYYLDPDDNACTAQVVAVAATGQLAYRLLKTYGGYSEPCGAVNGTPNVYLNGVLQSGATYTINESLLTFNSQPTVGQTITWTGSYYHRVRFASDASEFEQFMKDLWQLGKLELLTVKP